MMNKILQNKLWVILALIILVNSVFYFWYSNTQNTDKPTESENMIVIDPEKINIYFFYGNGCPHCAKEEKFLKTLKESDDEIDVHYFETWYNSENAQLLKDIAQKFDFDVRGVPFTIISDQTISGYGEAETTGVKILSIIEKVKKEGCIDIVSPFIVDEKNDFECKHEECSMGGECEHDCGCNAVAETEEEEIPKYIELPFFGNVETKNISLPFLTIIIAATDGFNPCAMWVLLFLINLLLGMKDKKRMWILGSAFIISSGAVYFLFLSAWLNLFLFLSFIVIIRVVIGNVAIASGVYHLFDWYENREGCKVTASEKRRLVFEKIKKIASANSFWIALSGIIILAAAVNLVELICSAGLPAVYTQILALSDLPAWKYYSYLLLYIIIFMADDMIVFFIAMKTLELKATDSKFTHYSMLIGGVIMVLVGIFLLFKPGWLMFG